MNPTDLLSEAQRARVAETWLRTGLVKPSIDRVGPSLRAAARAYVHELRGEPPPKAKKQEKEVYVGGRVESAAERPVERDRSSTQRFLLTCAQNNTHVHEKAWASLNTLARHYGATILVGRVMYDTRVNAHLRKPGSGFKYSNEVWFDPRLKPHFTDCDLALTPTLKWKGSMNVIPSSRTPLAGLEGIGRGASAVVPHPQVAMESIGRMHDRDPVFNYTTGAVTLSNYIERKAGQLAEFHHTYGALLVEIEPDDSWWARQVLANSDGVVCDLDLRVDGEWLAQGQRARTLVVGDLHYDRVDQDARMALWGPGGLASLVKPELTLLHDALDMHRRSHHDKPMDRYKRMAEEREDVREEVDDLAVFTRTLAGLGYALALVGSNHLDHLVRWLDEADPWRNDPRNAMYWMEANLARMRNRDMDPSVVLYRKALDDTGGWKDSMGPLPFVHPRTDSLLVGGVEHALHGDRAANGARGSPHGLAKLAARVSVGHSHTPGIYQGVYTAGTTSRLLMGYNADGPTRWAHAHVVLLPNGKRQIICPRGARYRAT